MLGHTWVLSVNAFGKWQNKSLSFRSNDNTLKKHWWYSVVIISSIPPSLSINYVAINKDLEKLPPKLYEIKIKICYDQGCNDIGVVIATKWRYYLAYVLPHFDALTHMVIRVSSAFIFQTFDEPVCNSVFVKRLSFKSLLNLRKAYIFQEFAEGLLSICVCWIFQSVHLSGKSFSGRCATKYNKSTKMWSSAAPFHHDLKYFWHRTNENFRSTYSERLINGPV